MPPMRHPFDTALYMRYSRLLKPEISIFAITASKKNAEAVCNKEYFVSLYCISYI